MVKKHKKHTEKKKVEAPENSKWLVIGGLILVFILINVAGKNNPFLKSIIGKFNPTPTPTPTTAIKMLPADRLNADQATYVKLAIDALTVKLDIKSEDIKVLNVRDKQWNDTSLGCPEKGKLYIQTITPGFLLELSAKGKKYYYNGGLNRVVSC